MRRCAGELTELLLQKLLEQFDNGGAGPAENHMYQSMSTNLWKVLQYD